MISWITPTESDSKVTIYYSNTDFEIFKRVSSTSRTKVHQLPISDLRPNTTYFYEVESVVDGGNGMTTTLRSSTYNGGNQKPSFQTLSPGKPDILLKAMGSDYPKRTFSLVFTNLGGTATDLEVTGINFSVSSYQTQTISPNGGQTVGPPLTLSVRYAGTTETSSLLCRINYRYRDGSGNLITSNSPWLRLK